jgi:hypothetical protein
VVDKGGTNPHRYEVQENTTVTFRWEVNNAVKVIFTPAGQSSQEVGAVGQVNEVITGSGIKNYTLIAENSVGQRAPAQVIEVTVVDEPAPDPPYNVNGTEAPGSQN